jgi:hypothetical protein
MPWRLKREIFLILMGCAVLVIGVIVLILNRDASTDLLAGVAILGGVAIIINTLPLGANGTNHTPSSRPPYDQDG